MGETMRERAREFGNEWGMASETVDALADLLATESAAVLERMAGKADATGAVIVLGGVHLRAVDGAWLRAEAARIREGKDD